MFFSQAQRSVIFLDIERVIYDDDHFDPDDFEHARFIPAAIASLLALIKTTNAHIIITADCRIGRDLETLRGIFSSVGFSEQIIGKTADEHETHFPAIKHWIEANFIKNLFNAFVILDHCEDYFDSYQSAVIRCTSANLSLANRSLFARAQTKLQLPTNLATLNTFFHCQAILYNSPLAREAGFGRFTIMRYSFALQRITGESPGARLYSKLFLGNTTLEKLTLCQSFMSATTMQQLCKMLETHPSITHLDIAYNNRQDSAGEEEDEEFSTSLAVTIAPIIQHNTRWLSLSLAGNSLREIEPLAAALAQNRHLRELHLSDNPFGSSGAHLLIKALTGNNTLQTLNINDCTIFPDFDPVELAQNRGLCQLFLNNNKLEDMGTKRLVTALCEHPTVTVLELDNNDITRTEYFKPLFTANRIKALSLNGNHLNNTSLTLLFQWLTLNTSLEKLELLQVEATETDFAHQLCYNNTLQKLVLSSNSFTPEGYRGIFMALEFNRGLQSLELSGVSHTEGAHHLTKNTSLQSLKLSFNNLTGETVRPLFEALSGNRSLKTLILYNNHIDDLSSLDLALAQGLQFLDLRHNSPTNEGMRLFLNNIDRNHSLRVLLLDGRSLTALPNIKKLENNDTLEELSLPGHKINEESLNQLFTALISNKTLLKLNLRWCGISHGCTEAAVNMVRHNTALKEIDLNGNQFSEVGMDQILEALFYNPFLVSLELDRTGTLDSQLTLHQQKRLHRLLERNRDLENCLDPALKYEQLLDINQARVAVGLPPARFNKTVDKDKVSTLQALCVATIAEGAAQSGAGFYKKFPLPAKLHSDIAAAKLRMTI